MADGTSSSLTVAAPLGTVLSVIADFANYPDWATGIRSADVVEDGDDGLARQVRFSLDAGPIKDSYVLAYEWDGDAGVRWRLAEPGSVVTQMSGAYLFGKEANGTRVKYELAVATRLPMPGMLKRRAEKMIIDAALRGLKERAEAEAAAQGGAGGQGRTPGHPSGR
jgi:Polyketide cyclase / dehydrase and lipid transport